MNPKANFWPPHSFKGVHAHFDSHEYPYTHIYIHIQTLTDGFHLDTFVYSYFIHLYGKV